MEARLILCVIGLCLTLPMALAIVLAYSRGRGGRPFLALVFIEAGLYFFGELASFGPGTSALSLALSLGSAFYGLPSLYFFAQDALGRPRLRAFPHYLPAIANVPVGISIALLVAARGYRGGIGTAIYMIAVELGQTIQLIAYGRGILGLLSRKAGRESEWPRRIALAALAGYGAFIALNWVSFGLSLASELAGRLVQAPSGFDLSFPIVAVLFAWTLGLCALWGREVSKTGGDVGPKYGGRPLSASDAAGLVTRTRVLLAAELDLSAKEVEPRRLAARLGEPYYLLSRAVNEGEGVSIADLVNEYRVERAKLLLVGKPETSILEVALDSGFQAKSTFNEVFRKRVGSSPSEYRSRNGAPAPRIQPPRGR